MIGVDYDLFWKLTPKTLAPFVKAFHLQQKREDEQAWLHGVYVRQAILSAMSKDVKYPKVPMTHETKQATQSQIKERFMRHANLLNKRFE